MNKCKLIYCGTPSRLVHKKKEIMDLVTLEGNAPLHPFQAMPHKRFEGNPTVGRERSMDYSFRLIRISDQVRIFGISEGTLDELAESRLMKKDISFDLRFDPMWKEFYSKLKDQYGDPLAEYRLE